MLQGAVDNVREDEKFCVRMRAKPGTGFDAIFVDDTQGAKGLVERIRRIVRGEGEGVECVEPIVVGMATSRPRALRDLHGCGRGGCHASNGRWSEDRGESAADGIGERQRDCENGNKGCEAPSSKAQSIRWLFLWVRSWRICHVQPKVWEPSFIVVRVAGGLVREDCSGFSRDMVSIFKHWQW